MKTKWKPQSTFQKLSLAFLFIGVLPLILVCIIFMRSYENNVRYTIDSNMEEANYFAQSKCSQLVESIDYSMGLLYDFSNETYGTLWEILENDNLNANEKQMYIGLMLDELLKADPAVSAAHFVASDGTTYSRFYSQQKSLRAVPSLRHQLPANAANAPRQLYILPVENEAQWCNGSNDQVLTLARNYMDVRSLHAISSVSLGTLYVDLRTDELDSLLSSLQLGERGNIYIVDSNSKQVLYQLHSKDTELLSGTSDRDISSFSDSDYTVYSQPIGDSNYQLMVCFDRQELYSISTANRTYLILLLTIVVVLILILSILFSGRISTPARQLKRAMEEVRSGNLDARVEIHSGDEMEYLGDSFNQMVETLGNTIEEVYVAQICQRDAELNALKMQIQPHYLYNTLDMIRMSALSQNDAETARLIESLSRQLRYMMGTHQDKVTLRQELDNLQEYSILMSTRSEGRIRIRMEAADCDLGLYIPKLLLQPFVENAVKHGLKDKPDGGTILIEAIRLPDTLQIMIFNDGKPIEPERLNHIRTFLETSPLGAKDEGGIVSIGMKNTYDRIKINCGNEYGFTIDSDETAGVVVTIRLPIWKEEKGYEEGPSGR